MHTDSGKEFMNKAVDEMLKEVNIFPTTTGGYDPKANGRAERYVGLIKQQATMYLIHSRMPIAFWHWAAKPAAYIFRAKALGLKLPEDAPTFGNRVLMRDHKGEEKSFAS